MQVHEVQPVREASAVRSEGSLRDLLAAMRPHHWIKNAVVTAAPLFALAFTIDALVGVVVAFFAFSLTASGFYLINDVLDREADRAHPVKRYRPIAAGRVPASVAVGVAALFIAGSLAAGFLTAPLLGATLVAYMALQVAYNAGFKREPIVDIMVIASGFVLRALGGAAAAAVPVSGWFVLCVGLLAFFLGLEKRKAELKSLGEQAQTRAVLEHYSLAWLQRMEGVVTASALMSYALWTIEGAGSNLMLATLPFVAYAIFKYQYLSEQGEGESPEMTLVKDTGMVVTIVLWLMTALAILFYTQSV